MKPKPKTCPACGLTLRSEFYSTRCRNTAACKKRQAKLLGRAIGMLAVNLFKKDCE